MQLIVWTDTSIKHPDPPRLAYFAIDALTRQTWCKSISVDEQRYKHVQSMIGELLAFKWALQDLNDQLTQSERVLFLVDNGIIKQWIRATRDLPRGKRLVELVVLSNRHLLSLLTDKGIKWHVDNTLGTNLAHRTFRYGYPRQLDFREEFALESALMRITHLT